MLWRYHVPDSLVAIHLIAWEEKQKSKILAKQLVFLVNQENLVGWNTSRLKVNGDWGCQFSLTSIAFHGWIKVMSLNKCWPNFPCETRWGPWMIFDSDFYVNVHYITSRPMIHNQCNSRWTIHQPICKNHDWSKTKQAITVQTAHHQSFGKCHPSSGRNKGRED